MEETKLEKCFIGICSCIAAMLRRCVHQKQIVVRRCWKEDKRIHLHFEKTKVPIDWSVVWFEDNHGKAISICQIDVDDHALYHAVTKAILEKDNIIIQANMFLCLFITSIQFDGKTYRCSKFFCDTLGLIMSAIAIFWLGLIALVFCYAS